MIRIQRAIRRNNFVNGHGTSTMQLRQRQPRDPCRLYCQSKSQNRQSPFKRSSSSSSSSDRNRSHNSSTTSGGASNGGKGGTRRRASGTRDDSTATTKATTTTTTTTASLLLAWYTQRLDKAPMTTKCITSGIVASIGDLICQTITMTTTMTTTTGTTTTKDYGGSSNGDVSFSEQASSSLLSSSLDWIRTLRFFIMGFGWVAPCTHYWYSYLNTVLVPGPPTVQRVIQRVMLDQLCFAPFFCPSFMALLWTLEGRHTKATTTNDATASTTTTTTTISYHDLWTDLVHVTPDVIRANWFVWIPANAINFSIIPLQFQVLYGNVVAVCWNVFLSYKSQWRRHQEEEEEEEKRRVMDRRTTTTTEGKHTHTHTRQALKRHDDRSSN